MMEPGPLGSPLVVTIPGPDGGMTSPTGVATNATNGFVISAGGKAAASSEIFATEDGTLEGWNPNVDPSQAVVAVNKSPGGAVYKGLAIGFNESGAFLFATNFHAGTIDVYDSNFRPVRLHGGFRDPHLPAGYAPFGIAAINSKLYVTFALQDKDRKTTLLARDTGSSTSLILRAISSSGSSARASSTHHGEWPGRPSRVSAASITRCLSVTSAMVL